MDNRAVSPLVAVMSFVAVAISLAGAVYLVSRGLSEEESGHVEPVALVSDERDDRVTVAKDSDLDWSRIQVQSTAPVRFQLNGPATQQSQVLAVNALTPVTTIPRALAAASYIDFCGDGAIQSNVDISLTYVEPGRAAQVLDQQHFIMLPACA